MVIANQITLLLEFLAKNTNPDNEKISIDFGLKNFGLALKSCQHYLHIRFNSESEFYDIISNIVSTIAAASKSVCFLIENQHHLNNIRIQYFFMGCIKHYKHMTCNIIYPKARLKYCLTALGWKYTKLKSAKKFVNLYIENDAIKNLVIGWGITCIGLTNTSALLTWTIRDEKNIKKTNLKKYDDFVDCLLMLMLEK